jgi:hypothetical protein
VKTLQGARRRATILKNMVIQVGSTTISLPLTVTYKYTIDGSGTFVKK